MPWTAGLFFFFQAEDGIRDPGPHYFRNSNPPFLAPQERLAGVGANGLWKLLLLGARSAPSEFSQKHGRTGGGSPPSIGRSLKSFRPKTPNGSPLALPLLARVPPRLLPAHQDA